MDQQQVAQQSKKRKKKKKNEEYSDCNTILGSIGFDVTAESSVAVEKKTIKVKKSRLKHKNAVSVAQEDDSQSKRQSPGNKSTLKAISDRNNSAVDCARTTGIVGRKRKHSRDKTEDSPTMKKQLKLDSDSTLTNILVRKTPKKSNSCTGEIPICEPSQEGTFAVDLETNTNSNAKPKYRSGSPPKSSPEACAVELVKYNVSSSSGVVKKDTSGLQAKPPSPKTHTYLVSSIQRSSDTNISEEASLPLEKQPALNNLGGSLGFSKTSPSFGAVRVKSEPSKSKLVDRKLPVFPDAMYPAMSVPIGLVMTTPQGSREEETVSKHVDFQSDLLLRIWGVHLCN